MEDARLDVVAASLVEEALGPAAAGDIGHRQVRKRIDVDGAMPVPDRVSAAPGEA
jgi:hypothetical protein